jgi:hypothetical protein
MCWVCHPLFDRALIFLPTMINGQAALRPLEAAEAR